MLRGVLNAILLPALFEKFSLTNLLGARQPAKKLWLPCSCLRIHPPQTDSAKEPGCWFPCWEVKSSTAFDGKQQRAAFKVILRRGQWWKDMQCAILQSSRRKRKESWASQSLEFEGNKVLDPWSSLLPAPKMCWTNLPAQLTSMLTWGWSQFQSQRDSDPHSTFLSSLQDGHCEHHLFCPELTWEGQGQEVACITDTLDFMPCFAPTLRFTLLGVARASGPKKLVPCSWMSTWWAWFNVLRGKYVILSILDRGGKWDLR